ncbi:MAG: hypothetical protein RIS10_1201 [Pseudomonadota bacterium]
MKTLTKEIQAAITPTMALGLLKEGNKRFVNNLKVNRNLLQQANETFDGQHPFAVILSCIDSRTSVELIFAQVWAMCLVCVLRAILLTKIFWAVWSLAAKWRALKS